MSAADRLARFLVPIGSGTQPGLPVRDVLSPDRRIALERSLEALRRDRLRASLEARDYLVTGITVR